MTPLVVLVGPPGAGKTTVGRLLAEHRHVRFRDTDEDVVASAGRSITDIFVEDGEPAFRRLERAAVGTALAEHDGVLALGAGAVLDASTQEELRDHRVIALDVSLSDAAARIGLNRDRPLLLGNPRAQLKALLDARRPIYVELAESVVDTGSRTPEDIVAAIEGLL